MIQYYLKVYNEENGDLKYEGRHCTFLDENNDFDFEIDPLPIGIQKHYQNGKVIEKDETDATIRILLNRIGNNVECD